MSEICSSTIQKTKIWLTESACILKKERSIITETCLFRMIWNHWSCRITNKLATVRRPNS